ncbi:PAS domain S-box protein [Natrinema zhouii]|uniref:histidine kinase n=1 Tax=Natrinema zhouii TaxID=1710539 RepID=A0A7D6CNQ9_9EURY|nr:PAS domain S-box protein [Natrinema zhouii]QLK25336.1 PAS domain S-box protein [Natrinema zhouii]
MSNRDESRRESVSIEPVRVLCVDGDPDRLAETADALERADDAIETLGATGTSDALERLAETDVDCIVSEYDLPDADGLALLDAVRTDDEDRPFVLFTDAGSEAVASEAITAGATDYLRRDATEYATLAESVCTAVETARSELQRQRQLRAIETAQEGISLLDDDGRFVYVNRAYADLYGYDPADLLGEHWERLYPDDELERARDEIVPTVMAEGDWYGETTGLRADGSTFVEAHSLSTTGNGDLICTVQDVTDRKERERDLERYETIIEALGDPVYTVDSEGRYAFVNDAYAEMTGYEKDEIVGRHVSFLLDDSSIERSLECIRSLLSDDTDVRQRTYEITVETGDGRPIRCEDHLSLLPLEDGRYRGVAGVVRDITERTARERKLERDETILETIPDEVYALDDEGYLTKIVPPINAEVTTTGYRPEELVGEHISIFMDDEDIAMAESEIRDLLRSDDRDHASFEMETITADGERVPNENHIATLPPDEDGRFQGTVGVLRDITDRKARERELKEQNERLERFASIVSHDLRNPLNVAQGRLEAARETCDCADDDLEAVAWAHDRMEVLIENILMVARERDPVLNAEPIDLAALVEDCWQNVDTADATLRIESDAAIYADRARLTQLLENLIRNAVEHGSTSPDSQTRRDAVEHGSTSRSEPDSSEDAVEHGGQRVTITVDDLGEAAGSGFSIADDGPGIPADERERVFESGYSGADSGTGLGLAIVKRIAEDHGWTVAVTDGDDGGTRFELTGVERADRRRADGDGE